MNSIILQVNENVKQFSPEHRALMLQAALQYAAHGLYIVPLHEPIFDDAGACVGCTCEDWKRSKKYQQWLSAKHDEGKCKNLKYDPNYKCRTPGKHPRIGMDWEAKATDDPAQVRALWTKFPTANIGMPAGKNGLVLLDQDKYKESFVDPDLLTLEETKTPTVISGRSGQNLVYQMPEGKQYGNDTGELPDGIDIRGCGGQFVVWPSIHPCGKQYEWEDGYSIFDLEPRPLPPALVAILDAAHNKKTPAKTVEFTTPTTEPPDLSQWFVGKEIRQLIGQPAPAGERSEADYSVCLSLVYAGATNEDILAVFEHCPIGTKGKFAESGRGYLARTIGRARTFAEDNPRPDVPATIELLRLWIRTHSFDAYVPPSSDGIYRTDATDTKVADAICDAMLEANRLDITIGKKLLGKLAGMGCNTAMRSLSRLAGWLFTTTPDKFGARVALVEKCRLHSLDPSLTVISMTTRDPSSENDKLTGVINEYSPRKASDPFLSGISRHVKRQTRDTATALDISGREALEQFTFKAFGESGLRVIDAMLRTGEMTTEELAEETGKKQSAIRMACARLVQHGLLEATREGSRGPKVYGLADDVWTRLEAIAPHLRTHKLSAQRENKRLESAQAWTKTEIDKAKAAGDTEQAVKLERRFAKQAATRITHLESLHPDLSAKEIERLAYEVDTWKRSASTQQAITTERTEQRDEHRANISMIRELAYDFIKEFADAGLKRPTMRMIKAKIMQFGVFDESTVGAVLWSQKQMSQYEAARA